GLPHNLDCAAACGTKQFARRNVARSVSTKTLVRCLTTIWLALTRCCGRMVPSSLAAHEAMWFLAKTGFSGLTSGRLGRSKLRTTCRSAKDCEDESQQQHATAEHQIRSEARLASSRDCEHNLTRYLTNSKDCERLEHKKNKYNRYTTEYYSCSALPLCLRC